ncbi:hypothetical protein [Phytomonospora endophytica]|uniref:Uncharacterized protein n=1 Tax=Phytomonospora endophytica TaxID=714109 RepID=A0A841FKD6_9ACTN|nr:hypothetical protein [Phytomonospora endophytica]MBB6033617.1 hypothetical protein [Phytomonospora endophytica]GIG64868.1 hypothetical protein Pen01_11630 [Phytomonospora endophytica]
MSTETTKTSGGFDGSPLEALQAPAAGGCCGSAPAAKAEQASGCCGTAVAPTEASGCCGTSAEKAPAAKSCCG